MLNLEEQLRLLKKINGIRIGNSPIYDFFSYKNYSLWSFYQHFLWRDIERFGDDEEFFLKSQKTWAVGNFFFGFWAVIVSLFYFLAIMIARPRVVLLTSDKITGESKFDAKIGRVVKFFKNNEIYCARFIHAIFNKSFFNHFLKRKAPAFYIEIADWIFSILGPFFKNNFQKNIFPDNLGEFSDSEKNFVEWIIKKYSDLAELSIFKTKFHVLILKLIRPRMIFMDDSYRYNNEFRLAAKILKIKTFSVQHGRFNKYLPGAINYGIPPEKCLAFDKYIVWNEFWREKLIKLSPAYQMNADRVITGGKPFSEERREFIGTFSDEILTVLIPYEPVAPRGEIKKYVKAIMECPKTRVIFKLRKDIDFDKQLKDAGLLEFKDNHNFSAESDIDRGTLDKIDLVLGTYSTMLYEMVESGKPVGILKTSKSEAEDMVEDGLAGWIDLKSEICSDMERIASTPEEILEQNSKKLRTAADFEETMKKIFNSND